MTTKNPLTRSKVVPKLMIPRTGHVRHARREGLRGTQGGKNLSNNLPSLRGKAQCGAFFRAGYKTNLDLPEKYIPVAHEAIRI